MLSSFHCGPEAEGDCRDSAEALWLKTIAMLMIFFASACGVTLPLIGKNTKFLRADGSLFFIAKPMAAGVILATGFVHILPDALEALTSKCLPEFPWRRFPFAGFISMLAALGTLLIDFVGTEFYERKHINQKGKGIVNSLQNETTEGILTSLLENKHNLGNNEHGRKENMHIVGIHAHAAAHGHNHLGGNSCVDDTLDNVHGQLGHIHQTALDEDELENVRHVVISQVLELGIITHSVIIGVSLGVSESPCTIRPLLAALSFHQFFEGFALGGCISQAGISSSSSLLMALFFTITTPASIGVGIAISSFYNVNSPQGVIIEGVFDSISAGILIYMALVNLIASDFLSKQMRCDRRLQAFSYISLFLGAMAMSSLALWA